MAATPNNLGHAQYTVSNTSVSLDETPSSGVALPDDADSAIIQTTDNNIRVRVDGNAATASVGIVVTSTTPLIIEGDRSALENLEMIREGSSDADVQVMYS